MKTNPELKHIQESLGFLPAFAYTMAPLVDGVKPFYELLQKFAFGPSNIDPKVRALIGTGVATTLGSRNMVAFHTQSVKLTADEINEAEFVAAYTQGWSTWLHGRQISVDACHRDVEKMKTNLGKLAPGGPKIPKTASTVDQIRAAFGFVPTFLEDLGKLPGALEPTWEIIRSLTFEEGHLTLVCRSLVGLAVASAVRCPYLVPYFTEVARMHGARDVQIQEASILVQGTVFMGSYLYIRGLGPEALTADALRLAETKMPVGTR